MGSGFVINGRRIAVPGLDCTNYLDDPRLALRLGEDYKTRPPGIWVRAIVLHTTKGLPAMAMDPPQDIRPGLGPHVDAGLRTARYWSTDTTRQAGAHLVVDHDGMISQTVDLRTAAAFHCPGFNLGGIGVEIYQGSAGELYEDQLGAVVRLCDFLTAAFRIQRQVTYKYTGPIKRLYDGGGDVTGVIGHRDAATNRGPGDPGSAIMNRLFTATYEDVNWELDKDRELWRPRQRQLGVDPPDGIAGPATARAIEAAGHPHGLWVARPGDDALVGILAAGVA